MPALSSDRDSLNLPTRVCAVANVCCCFLLQDCQGMQSCYQACKMTCPKPQPVVNGEVCKTYGTISASSVEQKACDITKVRHSCYSLHLLQTHSIGPARLLVLCAPSHFLKPVVAPPTLLCNVNSLRARSFASQLLLHKAAAILLICHPCCRLSQASLSRS